MAMKIQQKAWNKQKNEQKWGLLKHWTWTMTTQDNELTPWIGTEAWIENKTRRWHMNEMDWLWNETDLKEEDEELTDAQTEWIIWWQHMNKHGLWHWGWLQMNNKKRMHKQNR